MTARKPQRTSQCTVCDKPFTHVKANVTHCSNRCRAKWSVHSRRCAGTYVPKRTLYERTCVACEKTWHTRYKDSRYCSPCSARAASTAAAQANRIPRPLVQYTGPPLQHPVIHVRTTNRLTSGQCRVCNAWFISPHTDITCSSACQRIHFEEVKRLGRDRRRPRKRNAYVAVVYRKKVFEQDGYRCHLCGKKTDKTKQVPHPRAPTIDHVLPLAAGGTHEPSNCRTACFLCNATKGDRGGGEQLLLIA